MGKNKFEEKEFFVVKSKTCEKNPVLSEKFFKKHLHSLKSMGIVRISQAHSSVG